MRSAMAEIFERIKVSSDYAALSEAEKVALLSREKSPARAHGPA